MEGVVLDIPAALNRRAKLPFQVLNLVPIQLPEVWMVVKPMPGFDRRNLPLEIDARRQVQQCLDGCATRGPGGIELWRVWRSSHERCRCHHHVICRVGGRGVLIGDMRHARMFQGEDEVDGHG